MSFCGRIGDIAETGRDADIVEWRIADFLSLSARKGDFYESPVFCAWSGKWCFRIYIRKVVIISAEFVDLFLFRIGSDGGPPKIFHITVGVKGVEGLENKKERTQELSEYDSACCWYGFISRSEIREHKSRLMPGNVLTLSCDMKTVLPGITRDVATETGDDLREAFTDEKQYPGKKGVEELMKSLHGLLAGGEDSDVLVKVRGKEFPAHRAILRARSPVFQAMFSHDMVEKQRGVVTMEDCDPQTFPDFLEHVYTSSVEMISESNVFSLFRISDKYDLKTLKTECAEFMKQNLTVASFCNTITLAMRHGNADLIDRATAFFCENSLEIVETAEWQTFLQENSTVGNELFIKSLRRNRNE